MTHWLTSILKVMNLSTPQLRQSVRGGAGIYVKSCYNFEIIKDIS